MQNLQNPKVKKIIEKHGGIEFIKSLPLLQEPGKGKSRLRVASKIALELGKKEAAIACMKKAVLLVNENSSLLEKENRAKKFLDKLLACKEAQDCNNLLNKFRSESLIYWIYELHSKHFEKCYCIKGIEKLNLWLDFLAKKLDQTMFLFFPFEKNYRALKNLKVLDLACGSIGYGNALWAPHFCRSLKLLGAEPVGIDIRNNYKEDFKSFNADLAKKGELDFLENNYFDLINIEMFLALGSFKNEHESLAIKIGSKKFLAYGFSERQANTCPDLVRRVWKSKNKFYEGALSKPNLEILLEFKKIADEFFFQALRVLKNNGYLIFDSKVFLKRQNRFKFLFDFEPEPNVYLELFSNYSNLRK